MLNGKCFMLSTRLLLLLSFQPPLTLVVLEAVLKQKYNIQKTKCCGSFNHEHSAGSAVVIVSVQSSSLTKHVGRSRNKTFRRQNVLI